MKASRSNGYGMDLKFLNYAQSNQVWKEFFFSHIPSSCRWKTHATRPWAMPLPLLWCTKFKYFENLSPSFFKIALLDLDNALNILLSLKLDWDWEHSHFNWLD